MKQLLQLTLIFVLITGISFGQSSSTAVRFDGTDDWIQLDYISAYNVSKVTIEMWFLWENTTTPNDVDFLIGKGLEQLEIHTGGGAGDHGLRFIPTTGVYIDTDPNVFTSNTWNHIAFVYDPTQSLYKFYLNGVETPCHSAGPNQPNRSIYSLAEAIKIGMRYGSAMYMQGKIDEVRVWNKVRTAQEIYDNMNSSLAGNETGLVLYLPFNENSGTVTYDQSTWGNMGVFIGNPTWTTRDIPLPVELTSLSCEVNNSDVILNWATSSEVNNYCFEVEKNFTQDNSKWIKAGFVNGSGNSNSHKVYSFTDKNAGTGKINYRLKQIDIDGKYSYSSIVSTELNGLSEFRLAQNCPNPFNPSTVISYELPEAGFVSLKVYDITGREVAVLVNEVKQAGSYNVTWNCSAEGISAGVYLYVLNTGNRLITKKMTLLK